MNKRVFIGQLFPSFSDYPTNCPLAFWSRVWKKIPGRCPYIDLKGISIPESGVVGLFAILCATRRINWQIVELNSGKGIDVKCFDHDTGKEIIVELKHVFSRGSWNHAADEIDYVVCWENRWKDFQKPVIELRSVLVDGSATGHNTPLQPAAEKRGG